MKIDKKLVETLFGFGALGCLVLWVLEIQRVPFKDSYWLIMLFVACVLIFQYLRYQNSETAKETKPNEKPKLTPLKPSITPKRKKK